MKKREIEKKERKETEIDRDGDLKRKRQKFEGTEIWRDRQRKREIFEKGVLKRNQATFLELRVWV